MSTTCMVRYTGGIMVLKRLLFVFFLIGSPRLSPVCATAGQSWIESLELAPSIPTSRARLHGWDVPRGTRWVKPSHEEISRGTYPSDHILVCSPNLHDRNQPKKTQHPFEERNQNTSQRFRVVLDVSNPAKLFRDVPTSHIRTSDGELHSDAEPTTADSGALNPTLNDLYPVRDQDLHIKMWYDSRDVQSVGGIKPTVYVIISAVVKEVRPMSTFVESQLEQDIEKVPKLHPTSRSKYRFLSFMQHEQLIANQDEPSPHESLDSNLEDHRAAGEPMQLPYRLLEIFSRLPRPTTHVVVEYHVNYAPGICFAATSHKVLLQSYPNFRADPNPAQLAQIIQSIQLPPDLNFPMKVFSREDLLGGESREGLSRTWGMFEIQSSKVPNILIFRTVQFVINEDSLRKAQNINSTETRDSYAVLELEFGSAMQPSLTAIINTSVSMEFFDTTNKLYHTVTIPCSQNRTHVQERHTNYMMIAIPILHAGTIQVSFRARYEPNKKQLTAKIFHDGGARNALSNIFFVRTCNVYFNVPSAYFENYTYVTAAFSSLPPGQLSEHHDVPDKKKNKFKESKGETYDSFTSHLIYTRLHNIVTQLCVWRSAQRPDKVRTDVMNSLDNVSQEPSSTPIFDWEGKFFFLLYPRMLLLLEENAYHSGSFAPSFRVPESIQNVTTMSSFPLSFEMKMMEAYYRSWFETPNVLMLQRGMTLNSFPTNRVTKKNVKTFGQNVASLRKTTVHRWSILKPMSGDVIFPFSEVEHGNTVVLLMPSSNQQLPLNPKTMRTSSSDTSRAILSNTFPLIRVIEIPAKKPSSVVLTMAQGFQYNTQITPCSTNSQVLQSIFMEVVTAFIHTENVKDTEQSGQSTILSTARGEVVGCSMTHSASSSSSSRALTPCLFQMIHTVPESANLVVIHFIMHHISLHSILSDSGAGNTSLGDFRTKILMRNVHHVFHQHENYEKHLFPPRIRSFNEIWRSKKRGHHSGSLELVNGIRVSPSKAFGYQVVHEIVDSGIYLNGMKSRRLYGGLRLCRHAEHLSSLRQLHRDERLKAYAPDERVLCRIDPDEVTAFALAFPEENITVMLLVSVVLVSFANAEQLYERHNPRFFVTIREKLLHSDEVQDRKLLIPWSPKNISPHTVAFSLPSSHELLDVRIGWLAWGPNLMESDVTSHHHDIMSSTLLQWIDLQVSLWTVNEFVNMWAQCHLDSIEHSVLVATKKSKDRVHNHTDVSQPASVDFVYLNEQSSLLSAQGSSMDDSAAPSEESVNPRFMANAKLLEHALLLRQDETSTVFIPSLGTASSTISRSAPHARLHFLSHSVCSELFLRSSNRISSFNGTLRREQWVQDAREVAIYLVDDAMGLAIGKGVEAAHHIPWQYQSSDCPTAGGSVDITVHPNEETYRLFPDLDGGAHSETSTLSPTMSSYFMASNGTKVEKKKSKSLRLILIASVLGVLLTLSFIFVICCLIQRQFKKHKPIRVNNFVFSEDSDLLARELMLNEVQDAPETNPHSLRFVSEGSETSAWSPISHANTSATNMEHNGPQFREDLL